MFYYSILLFSNFKSHVKILCVKFMAFSWQPILFSYLHFSISYFIFGFRLAVPDLQLYCHPLWKQSLILVLSIIIRRLENEFGSFYLSLLNHLDQKIRLNFFFSYLFQYSSTTNTLLLTIYNTLTKVFTIDQKTTWSNEQDTRIIRDREIVAQICT